MTSKLFLKYFSLVVLVVCEITLNIVFSIKFGGWVCVWFLFVSVLGVAVLAHVNFEISKKELLVPWFVSTTFFPLVSLALFLVFCQKKHSSKKLEKTLFEAGCLEHGFVYSARAKYYAWGKDFFEDVKKQIKNAKKYVFFEFYIVENGKLFDELLEILKQKIQTGVEVFMLVDEIGSLCRVPKSFCKDMKKLGIKCQKFDSFSSTLLHNNRNHKKVVVVDGSVAFVGGVNLADEYVGKKQKYGIWKDGGVRVEGEGVSEFVKSFCAMFFVASHHKLDANKYLSQNKSKFESRAKNLFLQPSCVGKNLAVEREIVDLFEMAEREIKIATPYFIPDTTIQTALNRAANRGVKIKIFVPGIADKKLVNLVTKSFYEEQVKNGVEIWEFEKGFVHSKNILIDEKTMVVGTINLDSRSFFRNFECAVEISSSPAVQKLSADFLDLQTKSKKIDEKHLQKPTFWIKLLRLFAPML